MRRVVFAGPTEAVATLAIVAAMIGAIGFAAWSAIAFIFRAVAAVARHASWPDMAAVVFLAAVAVLLVAHVICDLREV